MRDLVDQVVPLSDVWDSAGQVADLVGDPARFAEALVAGLADRDADEDPARRRPSSARSWAFRRQCSSAGAPRRTSAVWGRLIR
ncbi:hypothetical protein [Kibdelosporangium aridum]|nr:hypothetical protein [Kibdelosporangium aridum]